MINLEPHGNKSSFLDAKTILATLIILAVFGGWYYYISKKYPPSPAPQQAAVVQEKATPTPAPTTEKVEAKTEAATKIENKQEKAIQFDSETMSLDLTSRGMGIKNVTLKKYKERDGKTVKLAQNLKNQTLNETTINGQVVYFDIQKTSETEYVGTGRANGIEVKKTIQIDPEKYTLKSLVEFNKAPQVVETYVVGVLNEDQSSSLLKRNYDKESVFVTHGSNEVERKDIDPKKAEVFDKTFNSVSIAAIDKHYFTMALVDKSEVMPTFSATYNPNTKEILGLLKYTISVGTNPKITTVAYVGPKKMKLLSTVDERLTKTINFGYFGWIANPILKLLKFLYSVVGNYGVAIILVTLLIRFILLPINISSYKSMKKMQMIQPELKLLKERYKNDPQRLQAETMTVMKANKVNPLGGCLPMLLQFPVFIALYNVLAQSIELYQAPFVLWIHDLSLKDPYYVLPVLMGITMFVQQKITPSAMDPTQAKMMQFMPVFFALLMVSLPSGLTLYIFVSSLFGILQQYMMMKEKKETNTVQQIISK